MSDRVRRSIRTDIDRLCGPGDRDLGTKRNHAATEYVVGRMRDAGLSVHSLEFEVPEWTHGKAEARVGELTLSAHPGPFSPPFEGRGRLVIAESADELAVIDARGAVLLLRGPIAKTQFTPRRYPFYSDPDHAAVLDALEASGAVAVLASTSSCAMTGAMSPFPLIEDVTFATPSAYLDIEDGDVLTRHAGELAEAVIDSRVRPSFGTQPVGRRTGASSKRIVICAHLDSKPETPGALDNAAGVAVLLAVADLLSDTRLTHTIEFVPFNGEDHVLAPGELAWLSANPDLSDIALAINIDAVGLPGAPSAYSLYGVSDSVRATVDTLARENPRVTEGPQWPASDHMIFAMRGVPAMAWTSLDFETASRGYSHTSADTPDVIDGALLAETARFIAALITSLGMVEEE